MPRRYKIGEQVEYDQQFDHLKEQSAFLNPKGRVINNLLMEATNDPDSLLAEWMKTNLPKSQAALEAAIQDFDKARDKAWRCGKPVPENEPDAIREKRLRAEAKVDIVADEIVALKRMAEAKKKAELARKATPILPHGPCGLAIGEPVRMIDNQDVVERDGELFISCKGSPYDGLALPVYNVEIVMPFLRACRMARKEGGRADAPWPKRAEA
ncbi:MAG: hypothetical protein WC600_02605 [Desulfobaccales bacterium]